MKKYETTFINLKENQPQKNRLIIAKMLKSLWIIGSKDTKKGITTIIFKRYL